jgi:hypothetical protein
MSERRFVIRELYDGEDPESIHWVLESELELRIDAIRELHKRDYERTEPSTYDKVIDILLHGEGKEPEKPPLRGMTIEEIQRNYPKEYAQALTEAEEPPTDKKEPQKIVYEHPCGATVEVPLTDKWEAWVQRMPIMLDYYYPDEYIEKTKQWFREMPLRGQPSSEGVERDVGG